MHKRIVFLDYMRAAACLMVIMVHSCEFFFINGSEIGIRSMSDGLWVSIIDSAFRCSVPLFVMISAWLLVPVKGSTAMFFKRRLSRVVIPFAVWSVLYALLPMLWGSRDSADAIDALMHLAYNFNADSGHLWFVYMLIGLYLFMPVISPWIREAPRRAVEAYLCVWFISTFFPYLRDCTGDIYGECYWNEYNMLWYFSGFLGYVVLACYIRRWLDWSRRRSLAAGSILFIIGYAVTAWIWYHRITSATTLQELELSWRFCTPNVVMMSFGAFVIIKALVEHRENTPAIISAVSRQSYGIYLMHIFVLGAVYMLVEGLMPTPLTIAVVGLTTFLICCGLTKIISILPLSRYIIG